MRTIRISLAVLVASLLLGAVYLSNLISQGHFALEQAARYNIVWAVNQSLVELTRLEQAIARAAGLDGESGAGEVNLRYQILLGRADVLSSGQSAEFVRRSSEYVTIVRELQAALEAAGPFIEKIDEPGSVRELDRILSPLDTRLAHLASAARQFGDQLNSEDQRELRRLHQLYTSVAGGLVFCGFMLIILLSWNNRLLGRAHRELGNLTEELRSVSDAQRVQNQRFQAALKNMSQGLCLADGAGQLVICNERFREMFGISEDALASAPTPNQLVEQSANRSMTSALYNIYSHQASAIRDGRSVSFVQEQPGGNAFSVHHVALADGGWLATYEDITERRRAELQIVRMAHHDSLTDLANRGLFNRRLHGALNDAADGDLSLAIFFIDLDGFKDVNDTLGHHFGDQVLRAVAARLQSCVRSGGLIARLGGDEFGILLPPTDEVVDYAAVASRIIQCIGEPYVIDGHEVVVGVSIGIAEAKGERCEPEQLLRHADLALYDVKTSGKGAYRFFEQSLDEQLKERTQLEADLRKAVLNGELEAFYQPAIETTSGRVSGFEALARWHHPVRGMVPPSQFIPIAEETGLIGAIGEWVLRQACIEASSWPKDVKVAVNVSAHQFRDRGLAETVSDVLIESGLCPSRLELEITETVVLQRNEENIAILHALRKLGIRIAMDDFGTGYSSLSYLLGFPFDKIKVDRSFVERVSKGRDGRAIVQLICEFGNKIGIVTSAEGVETEDQIAFLRSIGCKEMQGFYFSKPMRSSDVIPYLTTHSAPQGGARTPTSAPLRLIRS